MVFSSAQEVLWNIQRRPSACELGPYPGKAMLLNTDKVRSFNWPCNV